MTDLSVDLGFLKLKNPVIAASGTFGYGLEFKPWLDLDRLGGLVVKGLYYSPRPGNPPPRLVETTAGLINAIGLQGIGVERFGAEILPRLLDFSVPVFINVCGETGAEYEAVVEYLNDLPGIAAYELNISCPNVEKGGSCPALRPDDTYEIVKRINRIAVRPLLTKLSPNVGDIAAIAQSAEAAGSDGLSLVNTFLALAIDAETRKPRLANVMGGLSGPAIKPLALRMVYQVAQAVKIPIIGLGGIFTASDAVEFLLAGASAVQIGTANFINPEATVEIIDGLSEFGRSHEIECIADLTGGLQI